MQLRIENEKANACKPKKHIGMCRVIFILSFILIPTVYFAVFYVYVNLNSFLMAFQINRNGVVSWTLENFQRFFTELSTNGSEMGQAFLNTFYTFLISQAMFLVSFFVSYFLYKKIFMYRVFRVCFFSAQLGCRYRDQFHLHAICQHKRSGVNRNTAFGRVGIRAGYAGRFPFRKPRHLAQSYLAEFSRQYGAVRRRIQQDTGIGSRIGAIRRRFLGARNFPDYRSDGLAYGRDAADAQYCRHFRFERERFPSYQGRLRNPDAGKLDVHAGV